MTAGEPVTIFGQLRCRRQLGAGDRVVRLYHHLIGQPGYSLVARTVTDAGGFYQFQNADAPVTTNRIFVVRSRGAQSVRKGVRVQAEVKLMGPPEGTPIYTGRANAVTFTGSVNPADGGARVILQRQNALTGNDWHAIEHGIVDMNGAFSITHAFRYPGEADIRVVVRSQGRNVASLSNVLTYEISQAQNQKLTIDASEDPISFGGQVTISGRLEGGANTLVTLFARVRGQHFGPAAEVNTDGKGNYSFPAQMPVYSTFYRVEGGGRRSAVLFEGVRSVLTASVSQTSVMAGQEVTFSGTVAPDHSGGIIYLERRDVVGDDYHVIQVAIIGQGSAFSIEHRFYAVGQKIVRLYVPGGPQNAAGRSEPFTIEVTPAPAASLPPERGTNTSAPSEGGLSGSGGEEGAGEGVEGGTEVESEPEAIRTPKRHPRVRR
jgi:hypothetical protein